MKKNNVIGISVPYKTQGGEILYGTVIEEYPKFVVVNTEFGYRTCVHKTELGGLAHV